MKKLIDVYVYRIKDEIPEFLFLKRSSHKIYAHQWRMVSGKVEEKEAYWEAAKREFDEETQLTPLQFWVIPSVNSFYEAKTNQIHQIPAFAVEVGVDQVPILNDEHTEYKWATVNNIDKFMTWPEQKRLLRTAHEIIINKIIQPEWLLALK